MNSANVFNRIFGLYLPVLFRSMKFPVSRSCLGAICAHRLPERRQEVQSPQREPLAEPRGEQLSQASQRGQVDKGQSEARAKKVCFPWPLSGHVCKLCNSIVTRKRGADISAAPSRNDDVDMMHDPSYFLRFTLA